MRASMDAFNLQIPDETRPIIQQLSDIVGEVTNADHDTNEKLMEWSERKFQGKVNEKISSEIALSQVEFATKIDYVTEVLEKYCPCTQKYVILHYLHVR